MQLFKLLFLATFFFPAVLVFSQSIHVNELSTNSSPQAWQIRGTVILPDGYQPNGNIHLLTPRDSSFIRGDFFLEGSFLLSNIRSKQVLLQFTSLEFADHYLLMDNPDQTNIDLGEIKVSPYSLTMTDAVVVRAQRPTYTQMADGALEVLIANTTLATSNSTTEILARMPEVEVNEDGVLSILGKGQATLYLDGQPITLDQLALISPTNINKIAIIRNPSARYDASGGAVIEITTLHGRDNGARIRLQQNIGESNFGGFQHFSSANLSINQGRFAVSANYALRAGQDRHVKFTTRNRVDPAIFFSSTVNVDWQRELKTYHQYGAGIQYGAPIGGTVSLAYTGSYEDLGGNTFNTNLLRDNEEALDYSSTIFVDERDQNHTLSLNYDKALDTLGSSIFFGSQLTRFNNHTDSPIDEFGETAMGPTFRKLRNVVDLGVQLHSSQIDYTKMLSRGRRLEMGFRYGRVVNEADLDFSIANEENAYVLNTELSSVYVYQEAVLAAYTSYASALNERLNFSFGLRAEWTDYTLSLKENDPSPLKSQYLNLFPNTSLNWQLPGAFSLNFSYSARIWRPAFQSLNPNLIYQDPYTSIQGNPELVPEKVHAIEFTGKKGATALKLGYVFTFDPLGGGAIQGDSPRSYVLKRLNFSERFAYYLTATRRFTTDWWTSHNNLSLYYTKVSSFDIEFTPSSPNIQPYFFTDNRFRCGNIGYLELLFWYRGELREGTFTRYDNANFTISLERTFLQDQLKVRFIMADIFNTMRGSGDYKIGETDIYFDNKWRSNYARLAITFDLGKLNKTRYSNQATGAREQARI